jgi:hypothetical protein
MCSKPVSGARHLRRKSHTARQIKPSLRAPTVFDGPGCLLQQPDPKALYWATRLPWSTRTPGPIVLETETFFK